MWLMPPASTTAVSGAVAVSGFRAGSVPPSESDIVSHLFSRFTPSMREHFQYALALENRYPRNGIFAVHEARSVIRRSGDESECGGRYDPDVIRTVKSRGVFGLRGDPAQKGSCDEPRTGLDVQRARSRGRVDVPVRSQ